MKEDVSVVNKCSLFRQMSSGSHTVTKSLLLFTGTLSGPETSGCISLQEAVNQNGFLSWPGLMAVNQGLPKCYHRTHLLPLDMGHSQPQTAQPVVVQHAVSLDQVVAFSWLDQLKIGFLLVEKLEDSLEV